MKSKIHEYKLESIMTMSKKLFLVAMLAISSLSLAQTNYRPLYVYNYSPNILRIQITTCNINSVFNGSINGIVYPIFSTPATFSVAPNGGEMLFDYLNNVTLASGLSFKGTTVPNLNFWTRQTSPGVGGLVLTSIAQTYGSSQKWWYAKLGVWGDGYNEVYGNLGNWGNTVEVGGNGYDGYSVVLGNGLTAEWIEIIPNPATPLYKETFIIIS